MKIEVSKKNYDRLLEAQDEMDLQTIDETLDTILEFWLGWVDRATVLEQNHSYNTVSE
ncbi:MAG: hypothetical protein ACE5KU_05120 [Nitrososphaerales archaeon]